MSEGITQAELDELKALYEKAKSGPWTTPDSDDPSVMLLAALPRLLDEIEQLRNPPQVTNFCPICEAREKEIARLRELLQGQDD